MLDRSYSNPGRLVALSKKNAMGFSTRDMVDAKGKVVRYNLAYINHDIFQRDNGRVLGYDNAHGTHHRHMKAKSKTSRSRALRH